MIFFSVYSRKMTELKKLTKRYLQFQKSSIPTPFKTRLQVTLLPLLPYSLLIQFVRVTNLSLRHCACANEAKNGIFALLAQLPLRQQKKAPKEKVILPTRRLGSSKSNPKMLPQHDTERDFCRRQYTTFFDPSATCPLNFVQKKKRFQ